MAIPKFMTRDCELSTTGMDAMGRTIDQFDVATRVLRQLPEVFADTRFTLEGQRVQAHIWTFEHSALAAPLGTARPQSGHLSLELRGSPEIVRIQEGHESAACMANSEVPDGTDNPAMYRTDQIDSLILFRLYVLSRVVG